MTGFFDFDADATPLTTVELDGLIPTHITLRSELNELEQRNIAAADRWAFSRKRDVISEPFLRGLHRRMFDGVWRWAGRYRTTERNLGIASYLIETSLRQLIEDARYWMANSAYSRDELALRFHHRLVAIHPFANGNGRWSRLAGDLLAVQQGNPRFTWGRAHLQSAVDVRRLYIAALRAADDHDLDPLIAFARS
ncbi:MAG: mobile mystery protein B [Hyphomicrobiales bacterium]|nr:mobile mystery protein B [Hyphomicrobiales bacterium]MBV9113696.1 mobile mystery protein B [Hyphomicrobiales bacterium]MBV9520718.1 mobile mystery protein B [Hyphomicrobiales bacterium]